jgi:hypothetical protein
MEEECPREKEQKCPFSITDETPDCIPSLAPLLEKAEGTESVREWGAKHSTGRCPKEKEQNVHSHLLINNKR